MTELRKVVSPSRELEATFAPQLAMVGASFRYRDQELLVLRPGGLDAYADGATMGIPLLYPWANRLAAGAHQVAGRDVVADASSPAQKADGNGTPIHGVIPVELPFEVREASLRSLRAELHSSHSPALEGCFPFPHTVSVTATVTDSALRIETTVRAHTDGPVPVSFGYHPYLHLPGVPRDEWEIDAPAATHIVTDHLAVPTGELEQAPIPAGPLAGRTYDDGYTDIADGAQFALTGGGLRLTVRWLEGYRYAQVWAPTDPQVVCYEPMTAPTNALATGTGLRILQPGEEHRAAFEIEVA
jgi:galactose mutarotase-like enzyme